MLNKYGRAKLAKDTINKFIPKILASNAQARAAVDKAELILYSPTQDKQSAPSKSSKTALEGDGSSSAAVASSKQENEDTEQDAKAGAATSTRPRIRVIQSDTFDAAETLLSALPAHSKSRIGVLNMASALQPGGGVLHGALAQEETLCMRSTLYPSLKDDFYRHPEDAAVYTPDVLVFRSSDLTDLPKASWFFVDVVSCAALRGPDVTRAGEYEYEKDKETMVMKVRLILQIAKQKGVTRLVLGALGCGAFRNPPEEVAKIFKRVIMGDRRRKGVEWFEEIVFAIFDDGENLRVFREVFKDVAEE